VRTAATGAAQRAVGPGNQNPYDIALQVQHDARERFLQPLMDGPLGKLAKEDITTQQAIAALFPKEPLVGSEAGIADAVRAISQRNPLAARALVRAYTQSELDKAFNAAMTPEAQGFAGPRFAKQVAGNPLVDTQRLTNLRAAITALPNGANVWDGFNRYLEVMRAMGTRQPIGSRTAFCARTCPNSAMACGAPTQWVL
jgi:hypothetical protein